MAKNLKVEPIGGPPSDVEHLKRESHYLRGSLTESLADRVTGGLPDLDNRLLKFHGSYMQDDRDYRTEREKQKLEPYYQFMLRVVTPGGLATPAQWLVMDELADKYGTGSLKLTTRQAFQLHGVLKWNLKKTIAEINEAMLSTLAACGDVSRNVMCNPNPYQSEVHSEVFHWAQRLTKHLAPRTPAYHEIWLDGEKILDSLEQSDGIAGDAVEPIYGPVYLPRKFRSESRASFQRRGHFLPGSRLYRDRGEQQADWLQRLRRGGMGMTHGDTATYPQLAKVIGFVTLDQVLDVAEKTVTIQRDYGNRSVRKNARFKYTIDRHGLEWFVDELHERLGWQLQPAREYRFEHTGDRYGWIKGKDNKWNLTLFIQSGRVKDLEGYKLKTALREIAKIHTGDFRLTANQNLVIAGVTAQKMTKIAALLKEYGIEEGSYYSALRRSSLSCVALPTCGLAMAEAERYLPTLLTKLEPILEEAGLRDEEINIRMTGCPNGCARPALGEIAFIGKSPGKYNMYMGASFTGDRLSKMYRENIGEDEIIDTLKPIINRYAAERTSGEHFGDFVIRAGYVKPVTDGTNFHA
jgi:Sulfite reductase, beta subunit (hemoprotein)